LNDDINPSELVGDVLTMKIIQVNNFHRVIGGSDIASCAIADLLQQRGHDVFWLQRKSGIYGNGLSGKLKAAIYALYSPSACREIRTMIYEISPDIVHVHEVFPFISPWILEICRRSRVPVVMSCGNCRFDCPTAHHFTKGELCERCAGGREFWCLFRNCRDNIFESLAYTLRNFLARKLQLFRKNVTVFIAKSRFVRARMLRAGFVEQRIEVLPNFVSIPEVSIKPSQGKYFAFIGRVSIEKGVDTLLAAARSTKLPVRIGGENSLMRVHKVAPENAVFLGFLGNEARDLFYRKARCLILPSKCFDVNPLSVCEAMSYGLPVIASRIGGIPELVQDKKTGLLFEPNNHEELAQKMRLIWENNHLCDRLGYASRLKTIHDYGEDMFYERLMQIYAKAINLNRKKTINRTPIMRINHI